MAAQRVLQLLRSTQIYANFSEAESAIRIIEGKKDGEIVLARYISGTSGEPAVNTYESAIGVYFETQNRWTVFKSSTELQAALDALQAELDATQAGAGLGTNGSYTAPAAPAGGEDSENGYDVIGTATSLNDAVNKIAIAIEAMDHNNNYTAGATPSVTDASKVIAGINQTDGKIDSVTTDAVDLLLTGYANDGTTNTGDIEATDTIETALNKLENATAAGTKISSQTGNQLHYLSTSGEEGLATKLSIAALTENEIAALQDGANVREAYKLVDLNGVDATAGIGLPIKIYKDSALTNVYLGHVDDALTNADAQGQSADTTVTSGTGSEALCFIYHLENGKYKLEKVNVEDFLTENEFGDGLQVNSSTHVVSVNAGNGLEFDSSNPKKVQVKKDSNSQQVYTAASTAADVLTVSSDGVKVANVQAAINYATQQVLSTTVTSSGEVLSSNTKHISVAQTATTGLYNYAISETDIASEDLVNTLTGQTLGTAFSASGNFIGNSTDITDALEDLDAAVGDSLDEVRGSNAIEVSAKTAVDAQSNPRTQTISLILDDSTDGNGQESTGSNNALSVTSDGLFLSNIWDCGEYE